MDSFEDRLARFLDARHDRLWQAIVDELRLEPGAIPEYVDSWFQNIAAMLRGAPDRTPGWAASLLEGAVRDGFGPERAYRVVLSFRRALLAQWDGHDAERLKLYDWAIAIEDGHGSEILKLGGQYYRERLVAEQRRVRTLADALDAPIVTLDMDGKIDLANSLFARMLGVSGDALPGRALSEFCDEATALELRRALRQRRAPGGRDFNGALNAGKGAPIEMRIAMRPLFDMNGLRDGFAVTMNPAWMHGEEADRTILNSLERIANAVGTAIQFFDPERRVRYESPYCKTFPNGDAPETAALCCRLLGPRGVPQSNCLCTRAFATGESQQENLRIEGAHEPCWYQLLVVPMRDEAGALVEAACIARDISDQYSLDRQIREWALERQDSPFLSIAVAVMHELRNPLGVMLGFAEMLHLQGIPAEKLAMASERLLRNALRCKDIIENVMAFGQHAAADTGPVDLGRLLRERVRAQCKDDRADEISWSINEPFEPVRCNAAQLAKVIVNLIENARQFAFGRVQVEAWCEEHEVFLRVADDGPGVPHDLRDRIFDPFFTTRQRTGAIGLGLSLARAFARDCGGDLSLEDGGGPGASFILRLPMLGAEASHALEDPNAPRVLLVDDEADLREMLEAALDLRGYKTDTASSAEQALEFLERNEYAAAALDVNLPGMSGPELFTRIAELRPELAARVMFITADMMNEATRHFINNSKQPSMEKPFLVSEFAAAMERLLKQPQPNVRGRQPSAS